MSNAGSNADSNGDSNMSGNEVGHRRLAQGMQSAPFTRLFIALSLLLFTAPFIGEFGRPLGRVVAIILVVAVLTAVLVTAALAVSQNQRQSRFVQGFAAACLLLTLLANLVGSRPLQIIQQLLTICFLIYVVFSILRDLFRRRRIDYDTIAESLCGYLIIGVTFAAVYSLTVEIDPLAFSIGAAAQTADLEMRFGDHHTATSLYFSFVTLTTLGYGDIVAISMPARMLTTAEALIGQLYLTVLVARLVGLHISHDMLTHQKTTD